MTLLTFVLLLYMKDNHKNEISTLYQENQTLTLLFQPRVHTSQDVM